MYKYYSQDLLQRIKAQLKKGGIIAYPTEYCYGLGCDPFNRRAVERIIKLKGRAKNKGLIVIAGKISQLQSLTASINLDEVSEYWPGHYSLVLRTKSNISQNLTGKHDKIAVRVTKHKLVQQICASLHLPIVSTSANISGHRPLKSYHEVLRFFGKEVFVLPGLISFAPKPSTIIDWESKKIIRS